MCVMRTVIAAQYLDGFDITGPCVLELINIVERSISSAQEVFLSSRRQEMSSPTSNQNDSVFLKSIVPDCGEDVTHKRRENKVKLSLMTFNNLRSSAKSLLSAGKFGEAIVAYTQALDTVVRIVNVEVGQAAEVEQAEEEEIARQQAETARWDKFNSTNGAKPVVLATEPIEEESPQNKRSNVRKMQLSKRLKKMMPVDTIVKLYLGRAACFSKLNDHRRAVEDSNSALSLDTRCVKAYIRRGESLMQLQHFREASDAFRDGLQVDPSSRALKKGFQDCLEGLRVQWHQYFPTYGHTNASSEIAGDPTDAPTGVHRLNQTKVDPGDAQHDSEIAETLTQAGMVFDVTDLLKVEASWWTTNASRFSSDVASARDIVAQRIELFQLLSKHRSDLLLLFEKYCEVQYGERLGRSMRVSTFVNHGNEKGPASLPKPPTSPPSRHHHTSLQSPRACAAIAHLRPAYTPKSERMSLSLNMCKRLFLDCHLLTSTFGGSMVERAWSDANKSVLKAPRALLAGRPSSVKTRKAQHSKKSTDASKLHGMDERGLGLPVIFPKFLEVLVRVIFARYRPMNKEGFKPPTFSERVELAIQKHFVPSAVAIRAAAEAGTSGTSMAVAEDSASWSSIEVTGVLDEFRPRLLKVFDFFAQQDRVTKQMDVREFLFVLKSLGLGGTQRSDLHGASKIFASVVGYSGAADVDKMSPDQFIEALGRVGDMSTHDGMVPLAHRLASFFTNAVLQKAKHKTDIAALWL